MTSASTGVPEHVVDLFAASGEAERLTGGQGGSARVGDLVLSPGRDATGTDWLSPVQARLAVRLDERPRRGLRLSLPVPTRDGRWVVDGWAATRFEPGTSQCTDVDVLLAVGRLLNAELALAVPARPDVLDAADHRWARADRAAWAVDDGRVTADGAGGGHEVAGASTGALDAAGLALVRRVLAAREPLSLPSQLVNGDPVGNVLLDDRGVPFVIDLAPYWRPVAWADAVTVLDAVLWEGSGVSVLSGWSAGVPRQLMLRALAYRMLSDDPVDAARYALVVEAGGLLAS